MVYIVRSSTFVSLSDRTSLIWMWTGILVFHRYTALTYDSKKSVVHTDGLTMVPN